MVALTHEANDVKETRGVGAVSDMLHISLPCFGLARLFQTEYRLRLATLCQANANHIVKETAANGGLDMSLATCRAAWARPTTNNWHQNFGHKKTPPNLAAERG